MGNAHPIQSPVSGAFGSVEISIKVHVDQASPSFITNATGHNTDFNSAIATKHKEEGRRLDHLAYNPSRCEDCSNDRWHIWALSAGAKWPRLFRVLTSSGCAA
jgi:hypothetical protein